ncbi:MULTISPECIES: tRNA (adenosine(37)-N6)-dimethylallyltransferase MiaA [Sphingobacterium]|uniref:tRNA (adenosine(37)-N6)-dimethylallyltransferase MiaA n=1 Tax=Sphingobacterium TaxID=28453 RepID=UPI0013DA2DC0|nr:MULTISPECIES: tRNA (adenosine(37)-N6)-dimethylallyltransferase MiaA [unclassified Sphingobacterium]
MDNKNKKTLVVVVGPTAVGKTATAIFLAQHFKTEILSADSRQFYKEMTIGTAKPNFDELGSAVHHFIDSHSVDEEYSAGDYEREALALLDRLFEIHDVVIAVGGSGLFIRALTEGLDDLPKAPEGIRERLNALSEEQGLSVLKQRLQEVDPDYYAIADTDNPQRVIRALEVYEATGKPMSYYQKKIFSQRPFNVITIGLNVERSELYDRINLRVDQMIGMGLEEEAKSLIDYRYKPALLTVGYTEMFDFFDHKISFEEAVDKIKQNSRRYAKRQITWFKKYGNTTWFEPEDKDNIIGFIQARIKK